MLEERVALTAYLFVDFGDNFQLHSGQHSLQTTIGEMRDIAPAQQDGGGNDIPNTDIHGPPLISNTTGGTDSTNLEFFANTYTRAQRDAVMALVRRAYRPFDITVVELTSTAQTLTDGRVVTAAATLANVVSTLRGNNTTSKDGYVLAVSRSTNADTGTDLTGISGKAAGQDLAAGSNDHDDVAIATFGTATLAFNAQTVAHEAGHLFGLRHAVTTAAPASSAINNEFHKSEVMSYIGADNSSYLFSRVPVARGDTNTPDTGTTPFSNDDLEAQRSQLTPYDQLRVDPNVGLNTSITYVSGSGLNDVITIRRQMNGTGHVTVVAYTDPGHTVGNEVDMPGATTGTSYSYDIPLDRTIVVYGGSGADQLVLDGDLGVTVEYDGMLDTDSIVIDGKSAASAVYVPGATTDSGPDYDGNTAHTGSNGTITLGSTVVQFSDFESAGNVTVRDVADFSFRSPGGADSLDVTNQGANQTRVSGTVNSGTAAVPLDFSNVTTFAIDAGNSDGASPNDNITVESGALVATGLKNFAVTGGAGKDTFTFKASSLNLPVSGGAVSFDGGAGSDTLDLTGLSGATATITGPGTADGVKGTINAGSGTFDNVDDFQNMSMLCGPDVANTWSVSDTNKGTLTSSFGSGNVSVTWSAVPNLCGGSDTDLFSFASGSSQNSVDGNAGKDTLDLSALGSQTATLTAASANGFDGDTGGAGTVLGSGFADIDVIDGSSAGTADTLKGLNADAVWTLQTAPSTYVSGGHPLEFSNFEDLTGGDHADAFVFKSGGSADKIDGGAGKDSLDYSALAGPVSVALTDLGSTDGFQGTGTALTTGFDNIDDSITGSASSADSLTGRDKPATWLLATTSTYTSGGRTVTFSSFETLNGGSDVDTFNVRSITVPMKLNGKGGDDAFHVSSNAGTNDDGNLGGIAAPLTIDAGAGKANRLIVSNLGGAASPNVLLQHDAASGDEVIKNLGGAADIFYTATNGAFTHGHDCDGILIRGSSAGGDHFTISSQFHDTIGAASSTTVQGNGPGDIFLVQVHRAVAEAYARLDLVGGLNANGTPGGSLLVQDVDGGAVIHDHPFGAGSGSVEAAYLAGSHGYVDYTQMASVSTDPDADHSFVQALYHQFLKRDGSKGEIQAWVDYLHATGNRAAVVRGITYSPEAMTLLVDGWYRDYLHREARGGEEQGWVTMLVHGETQENVLASIFGSLEYFAQAGYDDSQFIRNLYRDELHRKPGDIEVFAWLAALRGPAGRGGSAWQVMNSIEARSNAVRDLYDRSLRRGPVSDSKTCNSDKLSRPNPSSAEIDGWVYSQIDLTSLAVGFASSEEFYQWAL